MFNRRIASENHLEPVISFMQLLVKAVHPSKHTTLLRNQITTEAHGTILRAILPYTFKFHTFNHDGEETLSGDIIHGEYTGEVGKGFVVAEIHLNHGLVQLYMTDALENDYAQQSFPINQTPKMSAWIQSTFHQIEEDDGSPQWWHSYLSGR